MLSPLVLALLAPASPFDAPPANEGPIQTPPPPPTHTLVAYAYSEHAPHSKPNLEYFLRKALVPPDIATFVIVVNGPHSVTIPQRSNVRVIQRENTCYDAGAWATAVQQSLPRAATHYVLLNGSVRGPFLPSYALSNAGL